jgi:hypothetical protein
VENRPGSKRNDDKYNDELGWNFSNETYLTLLELDLLRNSRDVINEKIIATRDRKESLDEIRKFIDSNK